MSSSFVASNANDEPPRTINQPKSPPSFSSLPNDIVWTILSRASKRSYPILSCVSKNFRNIVRSPEIHKIRSLLGKDSLYICFINKTNHAQTHWSTLRRTKNNPMNQFASVGVDLKYPYHFDPDPSIIAIGPEILYISGPHLPSSRLWIFDTVTSKIRRGPSMRQFQQHKSVGFVGSKIYVIGGYSNVHAESFDLKMQTWEPAPVPDEQRGHMWISSATASLNKKVYGLNFHEGVTVCYDVGNGTCESFELPKDKWWKTGVYVIDNVLYVYYARFGLMWYDFEFEKMRLVNGLRRLKRVQSVGMAEYYGKLAFFWKESSVVSGETKEIWCRMISLDRGEGGIRGTAEPAQLLATVPRGYRLEHCLSVSD